MTTNHKLHDSAINSIFLGVGKNNNDARNIHQHKTNHTDDPAETLQAEHRIHTLKHKERQPRFIRTKVQNTEKTLSKQGEKHINVSAIESTPTENEPTAIKPPPKQMKRGTQRQPGSSSKSSVNKKSKRNKKIIQGQSEIWRSQVQDPLRPLTEFVPRRPWFNFSVAFVKRQLLCLQPVGILKSCFCCSFPLFY